MGKNHVRVAGVGRQRKTSAVLRVNCRTIGLLCIRLQIEVTWSRNVMRNFTSLVGLSASVAVAAGDSAAPGVQLAK